MSTKVTGVQETIQALYLKANHIGDMVEKAIAKSAGMLVNDIDVSMRQTMKTGNAYKRGSKTHIASAEGEAPAVDTGRLVNSVAALKSVYGDGWLVGTNLAYGRHLEFGTKNMGARPWLIPALERNRKKIYSEIQKAMRASL
jgi:phage gpG-like protein